jgi:Tetracyclin repressor-like, C-terminal domain
MSLFGMGRGLGISGIPTRERTSYLALLELRLEATRRPELRASLTQTITETLEADVRFHLESGLPGDRTAVMLLYLAMTGLLLERLTLPDVVPADQVDSLIAELVNRTIVQAVAEVDPG